MTDGMPGDEQGCVAADCPNERLVSCMRATKLTKGCVVMMHASSGMQGYGNAQCVSSVCEPLGTISLYGHNQHYKDYDVATVLDYPLIECDS